MTDEQEKNLHVSSVLAEINDNGPSPAVEPQNPRTTGTEAHSTEPEPAVDAPAPAGPGRWAYRWLLILVCLLAGALAYGWYETRLIMTQLSSRLQGMEGQMGVGGIQGSGVEHLASIELRLAEIERRLDMQRAELQGLQPDVDEGAMESGNVEQGGEAVAALASVLEPAPEPAPAPESQTLPEPRPDTRQQEAEPEQEPELAEQLEPEPQPVSWSVILGSFRERSRANQMAERLASGSHLIEVLEVESGDSVQYRVAVTGLADPQRARELAAELQKEWGLRGLWVSSD